MAGLANSGSLYSESGNLKQHRYRVALQTNKYSTVRTGCSLSQLTIQTNSTASTTSQAVACMYKQVVACTCSLPFKPIAKAWNAQPGCKLEAYINVFKLTQVAWNLWTAL